MKVIIAGEYHPRPRPLTPAKVLVSAALEAKEGAGDYVFTIETTVAGTAFVHDGTLFNMPSEEAAKIHVLYKVIEALGRRLADEQCRGERLEEEIMRTMRT